MKCEKMSDDVNIDMSPLAEGRELKYFYSHYKTDLIPSPLAEGRELKFILVDEVVERFPSPLAEGRELK